MPPGDQDSVAVDRLGQRSSSGHADRIRAVDAPGLLVPGCSPRLTAAPVHPGLLTRLRTAVTAPVSSAVPAVRNASTTGGEMLCVGGQRNVTAVREVQLAARPGRWQA